MIRPTTAEELLMLMEEYEQNQAKLDGGSLPVTYETLSKSEQDAVFYITAELDVCRDDAVKAVAALGEDDANNTGQL